MVDTATPSTVNSQPPPTKRLIICCDGTWEDSKSDLVQPPSNVTRLTRSLSRNAIVEENGVTRVIPQIAYYQKGVGTSFGDTILGGGIGLGLSANVRAAYGFLADNYNDGDHIYCFGFSRGAYTTRAVAGLVSGLGLLTSRGMDNFSIVYNDYYKHGIREYKEDHRRLLGFRDKLPRFTIQIVGVWDTVGFHDFSISKWLGEKPELANTDLSPDIKYAFHALSIDETRTAFQPLLWYLPEVKDDQELIQVWFSGGHTDVGGGADDPRLSNIPLAWMIYHCTKRNQLSFDLDYFYPEPLPANFDSLPLAPWATSLGSNTPSFSLWTVAEYVLGGKSNRRPTRYYGNRKSHDGGRITNEYIHESIIDRWCCNQRPPGDVKQWNTPVLKSRKDAKTWILPDGGELVQVAASDFEKALKGRIRTVHPKKIDAAPHNEEGSHTVTGKLKALWKHV